MTSLGRQTWPDVASVRPLLAAVSPTGVLGDPTGASAAEGAQLLDELASALSAAVAAWPA